MWCRCVFHDHTFDFISENNFLPWFNKTILNIVINSVKRHHREYAALEANDMKKQQDKRMQYLQCEESEMRRKAVKRQREVVGYHQLQHVNCVEEAIEILHNREHKLTGNKKLRKEFLIRQIMHLSHGHHLPPEYRTPFSKKGDPSIGTEENLLTRLGTLFELKISQAHVFSVVPPLTIVPAELGIGDLANQQSDAGTALSQSFHDQLKLETIDFFY